MSLNTNQSALGSSHMVCAAYIKHSVGKRREGGRQNVGEQ